MDESHRTTQSIKSTVNQYLKKKKALSDNTLRIEWKDLVNNQSPGTYVSYFLLNYNLKSSLGRWWLVGSAFSGPLIE